MLFRSRTGFCSTRRKRAIYTVLLLSIQKHFQSSAKYCIRRGEITRKGNPCESSAKLENHFCDVLIECENDFSAFLFPKQEWNTKFIDLRGSSSFARSWAEYSWLSEHKFEGTNIRRDVLDFEGRIDTVLTEELNVLEVWRRSFDKWKFFNYTETIQDSFVLYTRTFRPMWPKFSYNCSLSNHITRKSVH